jgi:hypothetical protein
MAAGHAIPLVVFQGIQRISDEVGDKASFEGDRVEMSHGIPGSDRREEDIADEGDVVSKGKDKNRPIQLNCAAL